MKQLGFLMNQLGEVKFFGEYKDQYDKNNRHQVHDFSFTDEIEESLFFKRLNVKCDKEKGLYGKAIDLSLQGLVMLLNISSKDISKMIMYVPLQDKITVFQKDSLAAMNNLLMSFDEVKIVAPTNQFITGKDCFFSLNAFYKAYDIEIDKDKRLLKK